MLPEALPMNLSSPAKRRYSPNTFDGEDSENVDPSSLKRAKNSNGAHLPSSTRLNIHTPSKKPKFILTDAPPSPDDLSNPIKASPMSSVKRATRVPVSRLNKARSSDTGLTQRQESSGLGLSASSPTSTPAAGRSPKSKRIGILNKRRCSSPFTRIDPPSKLQASSPLSIDAALSGTISGYASRASAAPVQAQPPTTLSLDEKAMPKNWFFEIHQDTLEDTLTNIMEFSTSALDISDDEGRRRERADRGKENVPPEFLHSDGTPSATESTTEPASVPAAANPPTKTRRTRPAKRVTNPFSPYRAPLADLCPSDFYDEAVTSSSILNTASPVKPALDFKEPALPASVSPRANPFTSEKAAAKQAREGKSRTDWPCPDASPFDGFGLDKTHDKEIEIWESGSADGDNAAN